MRNYLIYGTVVLSMLGFGTSRGWMASRMLGKMTSGSGYSFGHK